MTYPEHEPDDRVEVILEGYFVTPARILRPERRWLRAGYLVEAIIRRTNLFSGYVTEPGPEVFWVRERDVLRAL